MKRETHQCYFCGDYVTDGIGTDGERHWLSDCRADLVEHEVGPTCTWWPDTVQGCYAYQEDVNVWSTEHSHFYKDGPM